jgi:hypothetical protein
MNTPHLFWARQLKEWEISAKGPLGIYHMARPMGFQGLCIRQRLKLAWGVFTGRYDAVQWSEL